MSDEHRPLTAADVADDNPLMVANHLRALQREMRDGFESMTRALTALNRIEERLDVLVDRQNVADRRLDEHDRRLAALEKPRRKRK